MLSASKRAFSVTSPGNVLAVVGQKAVVGERVLDLHNGRPLSFYTRLVNPDDPRHLSVDVINTGPNLSSSASRPYFQIFVRTLTG